MNQFTKDHKIVLNEISITTLTLRNCMKKLEPSAAIIILDQMVNMKKELREIMKENASNILRPHGEPLEDEHASLVMSNFLQDFGRYLNRYR